MKYIAAWWDALWLLIKDTSLAFDETYGDPLPLMHVTNMYSVRLWKVTFETPMGTPLDYLLWAHYGLMAPSVAQGGVSLTFRELSKMFTRNLCIVEIILMRISSWNFVRVQTLYTYKVSAWISHHKCHFLYCIFSRDYFGRSWPSLAPVVHAVWRHQSIAWTKWWFASRLV